jgi:hypothetical protein
MPIHADHTGSSKNRKSAPQPVLGGCAGIRQAGRWRVRTPGRRTARARSRGDCRLGGTAPRPSCCYRSPRGVAPRITTPVRVWGHALACLVRREKRNTERPSSDGIYGSMGRQMGPMGLWDLWVADIGVRRPRRVRDVELVPVCGATRFPAPPGIPYSMYQHITGHSCIALRGIVGARACLILVTRDDPSPFSPAADKLARSVADVWTVMARKLSTASPEVPRGGRGSDRANLAPDRTG